jgi:hypothetical protein
MDSDNGIGYVVATVAVVLIVLLVLFARAPEDHERSGASLPFAVALIAA